MYRTACELTEDQKKTLQQWARRRSLPARRVERTRVILLAAAGKQDLEIAAEKAVLENGLGRFGEGCPWAGPHADDHSGQSAGVVETRRRNPPARPSRARQ